MRTSNSTVDFKQRKMDPVAAVRSYIPKMLETLGMKTFLLDRETAGIIGMVISKTELLKDEVVDIDQLHERAKRIEPSATACVVFVRPTQENIRHLCEELRDPKFRTYHLFFSNIVQPRQERKRWIEDLAAADEDCLVRQVQELYGDYYAINDQAVTLNLPNTTPFNSPAGHPMVDRTVDGVTSLLLSMKKLPVIRYLASSTKCIRLAREVAERVNTEGELFSFRNKRRSPPLLLIIDRREDPVTPLLKQWTYQAMAHELIGIHNNVLDLSKCPGGKKDMEELVMDSRSDTFYRDNMYLNFGEIGENIKQLVDEYQAAAPQKGTTASIEDLQTLMQDMPEIRAKSGAVSKHVALVFEFKRQTETRMLMELSQVEQELAVTQDHAAACEQVANMLHNPRVSPTDALRLVMLYNLRYENNTANALQEFMDLLSEKGLDAGELALVQKAAHYGGMARRSFDIFENKDTMARMRSFIKQPLKDIKNVYTQHTPLLQEILRDLFASKLDPALFPATGGGRGLIEAPEEVIIFMMGGATYEESLCVASFNEELQKANVDARVILASTHFHNSDTFLEEVEREGGDCRDDVTMRDSDVGGHPIQNHTVRSRFRGE